MPEKGRGRHLTEIVKNNILYHLRLRSNLDFELPNGSYDEVAVLCKTTGEAGGFGAFSRSRRRKASSLSTMSAKGSTTPTQKCGLSTMR